MDKRRQLYEAARNLGLIQNTSFEVFSAGLDDPDKRRRFYDGAVAGKLLSPSKVSFEKFEETVGSPLLTEVTAMAPDLSDRRITGKESPEQIAQKVIVPNIPGDDGLSIDGQWNQEDLDALGLASWDHIGHAERQALTLEASQRVGKETWAKGKRFLQADPSIMVPDIKHDMYEKTESGSEGSRSFYDPKRNEHVTLSKAGFDRYRQDFAQDILGRPITEFDPAAQVEISKKLSQLAFEEFVPEEMLDEYAKAHNLDFDKSKTSQFLSQLGVGFSGVVGSTQQMLDRLMMEGYIMMNTDTPEEASSAKDAVDYMITSGTSFINARGGGSQSMDRFCPKPDD